ncbi:hypothetical protein [Mariluticola halotolerans]|uniref:hypothetical protein n=1 Tax=Mariluticola halotolerans TaxID=2909283 RepID=UPI0026E1643E|nr:hypothetical protein [Mariluticola halotolerans]UJQ93933.1 hypothetical protein L1P08_13310 [Mariluticola halotolerans]
MPKPAAKTTLYRLIEAGHLARQKMLVPLYERGLEAGDDAFLFALDDPKGAAEQALTDMTGLGDIALEMRLVRLAEAGVIERVAVGPDLLPGARLTAKGRDIADVLAANWQLLEDALTGELDHAQHKNLRKILKRFVKLLNL